MNRPRPLPPGVCLTDVWDRLPVVERRRWLRIVAAEAAAVRAEAARYRGVAW